MPPWSLGRISAVARDRGFLYAGANPRGMQGYAVGRVAGSKRSPWPAGHGLLAAARPADGDRRPPRLAPRSASAAGPVSAGSTAAPTASTSSPSPAAISGACGRSTAGRARDSARCAANR